jgi:hypothetical protein
VALLAQILVAFGNVIGRIPHALADGARHAMNLFVVLVGVTSKARKGTAWAHVQRLFKRADEQWAQDCIVNGLSSGEGVIWAVRDPISKTVKGETEIVDAGVEDKRLCVVEGEFANVLKVMTREATRYRRCFARRGTVATFVRSPRTHRRERLTRMSQSSATSRRTNCADC